MNKNRYFTLDQLRNTPVAKLNQQLFNHSRELKENVSKYRNTKTRVGGIDFDSEKEAMRYKELRILLKAGKIGMLARQVEYSLQVKGTPVASYVADFEYLDAETGKRIVEDVKSIQTRKLPVYRLKKKLMKRIYGIEIKEY